MYIKRAILTNIGRHRRLDVNFKHGLCAIMGPNGSGKSTLIDAIHAVMTADWSRFDGTKEQSISNLAGEKEESSVWLQFEHNADEFELYGALRAPRGTPANSLIVGGNTYTKVPEIKAELEKRLGVSAKMLSEYVFVKQWEMRSPMLQTDNERAATYQLLCGTGKAEKLYIAIGKLLEQDTTLNVSVPDNSDELRQRRAELQTAMTTASTELTAAKMGLLSQENLQAARRCIDKRSAYDFAVMRKSSLDKSIATKTALAATQNATAVRIAKLVVQAEQLVAQLKLQADSARLSLGQLQQFNTNQQKRQLLISRLDGLAKTAAARKPVTPHPQQTTYPALLKQLETVNATIQECFEIQSVFDSTGVVKCPTCGTPIADLEEHLKSVYRKRETAERTKARLQSLVTEIQKLDMEFRAYTNWKDQHAQATATLQSQLDLLTELSPVTADPVELNQAIADHEEQSQNLQKLQKQLQTATNLHSGTAADLRSDVEELATAKASMAANSVSDAALAAARDAITRHDKATTQVAVLTERVDGMAISLQEINKQLKAIQIMLARQQKAQDFASQMRTLREEVFHRMKLPRQVAETNLYGMEKDIAASLHDFGDPFRVTPGENLTFTVHFPGEPAMPATRLSGGLQGVLAMAFRLAVLSVFGADIGMMALDEPTVGFDSGNIRYLGDALQRFAGSIRGRRQVFIITHAESLAPAFDQVIKIGQET